MELLLHKTKLQLPLIPPKTYFSARLKELSIAENRLSILLAPSGFGKTTAILLSLKECRDRIAWYRLEQEDSFLDIFYHHLIAMLFSDAPEIMKDQLKLLYSLQNFEEEASILNAQICQDMTYLHAQDQEALYLVFDDFQWLTGKKIFIQIFRYFVRNMPPCVRIIITSRTDPMLLTGRLCLNELCRQYSFKDLLFEPEEIKELIEDVYHFSFSKEQIDFVRERSKGWVAGIYLLSHTIESQPAIHDPAHLSTEMKSFFSHYFQEYLLSIDDSKKARLMELALLDDFSLNELSDLFKQENPQEFLQWLEINQLCFQTNAGDGTRYFFHSLLSDELRNLYAKNHSTTEQQEFYRKIADYYYPDNLLRSLQFYLLSQNEGKALELAAGFAKECFNEGKLEVFFPILSLFREEQISKNPYLLLMEGMRVMNQQQLHAQTCFMQALEAFKLKRDYSFMMNSFGMLLVVAYQLNDFDVLEEASRKIPLHPVVLRGGVARLKLIISSFIELIGKDRIKHGAYLLKYLDKKEIKEHMWHFSYLMIRGIYFYRKGDLNNSRKNLERILAHPVMQTDDQWRTIGLVSCCNVAFLQADLQLLQYFVGEFTLLAERLSSTFALGYAHYLRGFLHYLQKNQQEALTSMTLAKEAFLSFGGELVTMEAECFTFLMTDRKSDEDILRTRAIYEHMKMEKPGHGMEEFTLGVLGILLKRAERFDEAEEALQESLKISEQKGALQSLYSLHLQLADLYLRQENLPKGEHHFKKWVELGKNNGYLYGRKFTHQALDFVMKALPEQWSACSYCQEVMRFYEEAKEKSQTKHTIHIHFLGPFSLRIGNTLLSEKDFKTRKVSGLLKYILARQTPQSREYLASVFWPESDRKSAGTSLRVALYELRKSLSTHHLGFDNEDALLEENKEGFTLSYNASVETDTQELVKLYEKWQMSSPEEEMDLLLDICKLYRGHFLEIGDYDDWVTIQREHYSGIYYEALHALGALASNSGYLPAAEYILHGLELDPLDEVSYAHLIALYGKTGQLERAQSLRKQFKKRFKREMGFEAKV